jgi:CBS domain-containing protein
MSVSNVMTREVISIKASSKVRDAWVSLMKKGISGAPLVDDSGRLVGILSVTDIYRAIIDRIQKASSLREATSVVLSPADMEKEELREMSLSIRAVVESPVTSVIPKDQKVLSLSPEDSLDRAIHMMAEHNINRLPVVHENHVVGIITRQDIIWIIGGRPKKGPPSPSSNQPQ